MRYANSLFAFACTCLLVTNLVRAEVDMKLTAKLDTILGAFADSGTTYVARIVDPATGRELYLHDPDRPVAPASNAKLPNVAAALDRFGPGYIWRTYLAIDSDDLWIIGTGDPSCGDRRIESSHGQKRFAILDDFADALAKHNITHIKGNLLFDDGIFDDQRIGPTWPKSELTDSWSAPLTGLSFNANCIEITASPDHIQVLPETQSVKIINQTHQTGDPKPLSIERDLASDTFILKGLITKKEEPEFKAITDPGLFFADALRTKLKSRGITLDGQLLRASRTLATQKWNALKTSDRRDDRILATHETIMSDVMKRIDKQSQNLFADALCKLQGRAWDLEHGKDQPGNWPAGGAAIHDFLKRSGIDDSKYILVDGSGLSSDNRVTARLLSDVLLKMLSHKYSAEFRDSLSICGVDGTLDDRMMDIPGLVHGKSGTIDGVKALSGYLTTHSGQLLVFSMIFNNAPPHLEKRCANLLDDACRLLVQWPDIDK